MNQAGAAGEQGAFREQGLYTELMRPALSETLSNASRPPSYTTVSASSLAIEETARKARAANYAHHTDCKSLVSTGDRPSLDETHLKYLEGQEEEDYDDSDDEPSIYVDASCVHDDLPSSSGNAMYRDILQAIQDLQQDQESLRALHAEHDRKLEELLRQQPMVNKHLRVIRQNSIRGNGTSSKSNNNSSSRDNTINNNDSILSSSSTRDTSNKNKNSSSSSRNNTHNNSVSNREQNVGNNGSCTNNSDSTSINSSRDASNHNKSISTGILCSRLSLSLRDQRKNPGSAGSSNDKNNEHSDSSRGNGNTSSSNNRKKDNDDNEVSSGSNNAGNENSSRRNCSDNGDNNEYVNSNLTIAASGGEVSPQDEQVIRRKTSKGGLRDDVAVGAFQRFILSDSEQQSHIYFQLERLYSNFQRLHIPSKILRSLMAENMAVEDPATRQGVLPNHVIPPKQTRTKKDDEEETRLRHENEELKKKIEELQKEIEQIKKDEETSNGARRNPPPMPPKPRHLAVSDTSRGRPVLQNTKQQARKLECVTGRPTSPRPPPLQPRDIDIREISVQHKIGNYRQKFHDEVHHEGQKQVSSSFYTAHSRCRAQLEVFLNGNGTGRGRCMSLFVRVVPGEFDDFIKWPITMSVRATLMNQNRGLTHSVEDSGNQFQFSKPRSFPDSGGDDNCWGLVEFVTHEMISQPGFIKDDSIVLRCKITFPSHLD